MEDKNLVIKRLDPKPWTKQPATPEEASSSSTVQNNLNKACDYIKDDGVGMVGIHGMGGVGKTTLLKTINNHLPAAVGADRFDHVIWLVASQDLNINKLQQEIAEKVIFKLDFKSTTVEERGESLSDFLKEKKILLFLDDIWQPIELQKLGVRFPTNDNDNLPCPKVVFTTRSEKVYNEMKAYHSGVRGEKIRVDCLNPGEAWELFLNNVGATAKSSIDSNEKVREFAKEVAKKCGRLPLALKVIGRAMSSNETWNEWEVALDSLSAFDIEELWRKGDDPPFPLLKRSYDSLPNDTMRKYFLSCCLWPEDAIIEERDLIQWWVGLDLITDLSNYRLAYNKGVTIIQGLKRAGLLEEVEDVLYPSVKMHDIIRGMGLWIASDCGTNKNKWIVHSGGQEKDVTNANWGEAEVISLKRSKLKNLPPSFPNLSALFLDECKVAKDVLFQNMPALKCLNLTDEIIYPIPSSIGCLVGLRSLTLCGSGLVRVPIEVSYLKELKYLWLGTFITSIPHGLISKLKKLEFLWIEGYRGWEGEAEASVEELIQCSGLKTLGIDIYTKSMMEQLICGINHQVLSLWHIRIREFKGVSRLALFKFIGGERGALRANLHSLSIKTFIDLKEIVVVRGQKEEEKFTNLQSLSLYALPTLEKIAWEVKPGVVFRNVTVLRIEECSGLKNVTWIGQLLSLERLSIHWCSLVQVIGGSRDDDDDDEDEIKKEEETLVMSPAPIIFSHLKYLSLYKLRNLTSFSSQRINLPSLKYLQISECPRLDLSPFSNHTIH